MKSRLLLILGLLLPTCLFGQLTGNHSQINLETNQFCGQHEALDYMQENHPERYNQYVLDRQALEQETQTGISQKGTLYTIPIVFHIIHNNGAENITQAQIDDALFILNRDFRKQNADVNNVVPQFFPIAADAEIQFEYATVAPDGTCFNGVTRTQSTHTSNTSQSGGEAQINAIIAGNDVYQGVWPHNKYLNVIVAKNLIQGAAGYTFLPNGSSQANASNMYYNSVFMLHNYTGSIGTSAVYSSRALTHEVGHWLNLSHTWGNGQIGTCGTDNVADTPQTNGSNGVCSLTKVSCDGNLDNVENYMDYSYCSKMFTAGQVSRMRTALTSTTGGRNNVWSTNNLQQTGVLPGASNCSLSILADPFSLCAGTSTSFEIIGVEGTISSYSWSFPGGTPSTSTAANPTVTYNTTGQYDVSVTFVQGGTPTTISQSDYINVIGSPTPVSLPIEEGFVGTTFPPAGWSVDNGGHSTTWSRATVGTAPTTGNSARLNFDPGANTTGNVDDLNTPVFSLDGFSTASLTFDVAYRPYSAYYYDKLEVLVSSGCGMPYEVVYSKEGTTLQTQPASASAYTNPTQWRNESIDLNAYLGSPAVSVKFRGISGYGQMVYIDNVNISGVASNIPPTPAMSANTDQVCAGSTVSYTDASTNNPTSWNWSFPGGTPATSTAQNPTVTYNTPGNYNVTLSATNAYGTTSETFSNAVTVNAIPTVSGTASPATICQGESSTISASGAASYTWSNGLGAGNSKVVSPSGTMTYQVTGTLNGCSNTSSVTVTVTPPVNVTATASQTKICEGQSTTIQATGGTTYSWSNGLGNASSHEVSPTTTTTYTVTGSNGNCSNTSSVTIVVDNAPVVNATASATVICPGDQVLLSATGASNYSWTPSTYLSNNIGASVAASPTESIVYTVTGTNSCGSDESSVSILVNDAPATPIISEDGVTLYIDLLSGQTATWYLGGNAVGTGDSYTALVNGNYTVVVTNNFGCTSQASKYVSTVGLSLNELDDLFEVYPNPTQGVTTISSSASIDMVVITDNIGRVVRQVTVGGENKLELDLSNLAAGTYQIQVKAGTFMKVAKIIVQ